MNFKNKTGYFKIKVNKLRMIKVAIATVVITLKLHINTNKIDHVLILNVYIFYDEGYL